MSAPRPDGLRASSRRVRRAANRLLATMGPPDDPELAAGELLASGVQGVADVYRGVAMTTDKAKDRR